LSQNVHTLLSVDVVDCDDNVVLNSTIDAKQCDYGGFMSDQNEQAITHRQRLAKEDFALAQLSVTKLYENKLADPKYNPKQLDPKQLTLNHDGTIPYLSDLNSGFPGDVRHLWGGSDWDKADRFEEGVRSFNASVKQLHSLGVEPGTVKDYATQLIKVGGLQEENPSMDTDAVKFKELQTQQEKVREIELRVNADIEKAIKAGHTIVRTDDAGKSQVAQSSDPSHGLTGGPPKRSGSTTPTVGV
jgi:hypothetical protein